MMIRSLPPPIQRAAGRGRALWDYGLVAAAHPGLLREAVHVVWRRKARAAISARRARLAPDLAAADDVMAAFKIMATERGFVVLARKAEGLRIGVADVDFGWVVAALQRRFPAAIWRASDRQLDPRRGKGRKAAAAAGELHCDAGSAGQVVIERYALRIDGVWVSGNTQNRKARALYADYFDTPGLHDINAILPAPTAARIAATAPIVPDNGPIDVVYTWVNHNDPDWARMFHRHKHGTEAGVSDDAQSMSRFHSADELRYSLRSVEQNLPWVRHIHVFTNCARPDWLKANHPRVIWVDHSAVIPAAYLPTFSSHVIESFLHHIPDLSQRFLYLNDDMFIARPLAQDFFFDNAGRSHVFLESYGMVSGTVQAGHADYLNAARNAAQRIYAAFGHYPTQLHQHTAYALRRDIMQEIEELWPDDFHAFRQNKFRKSNDLNTTSFLYHHYALCSDRAVEAPIDGALVKQRDIRWKRRLRHAGRAEVDTICINEGGAGKPSWDWHRSVQRVLQERFPQKAAWET